jgi:hypothetical protein
MIGDPDDRLYGKPRAIGCRSHCLRLALPNPLEGVTVLAGAKPEDRPMDAKTETLTPSAELARDNSVRIPNESAEYRAARTALLAEEIELRRHIERVAAQRRVLPPGGAVTGDYRFQGEDGSTDFAGLFAGKQTLGAYSYMFGPQRERPCPMCTNLLGAWEATPPTSASASRSS